MFNSYNRKYGKKKGSNIAYKPVPLGTENPVAPDFNPGLIINYRDKYRQVRYTLYSMAKFNFNSYPIDDISINSGGPMANTYHQIYIQTIFAVKYRKGIILEEWEDGLHRVIGNLINQSGGKSILVNGIHDHIHCFFHIKPSVAISKMMQSVKAKSSKWINENRLLPHRFEWQSGFGCFSYGHSQKDDVYQYIKNQKKHHKVMSFQEEYECLLDKFNVEYDQRYVFSELK